MQTAGAVVAGDAVGDAAGDLDDGHPGHEHVDGQAFLYDEIRRRTPFTDTDDYILISKMPSHNVAVGAALPYIRGFLEDIGPGHRKPAPADDKTCSAASGRPTTF